MMKRFLTLFILFISFASLAYPQRSDLSGIKICIDPGHGGYDPADDRRLEPDPGNVFWESESNFQKALLLKSLLEAKGATVYLTRTSNDVEPSLPARVAFANSINGLDWFHSIHSNAFNATANYTVLLVRESTVQASQPESAPAQAISQIISLKIRAQLRTTNSYTRLDYSFLGYRLGVLNGLGMPGQLSEGSFHDVPAETRRLLNNSYRKMEAYALRDAFWEYYGVPADTLCIVAGILSNTTGVLVNGAKVRLLPENIVYTGDSYNNGFYMFDGVKAGAHTLSFETPNYETVSVPVTLEAGKTRFVDRSFVGGTAATIRYFSPATRDTIYPVNQYIGVTFSIAMDTASVRQAFSITPAVSGKFTWYDNLVTFLFKPDQPFQYLTWYTYRIAGTARTAGGGYLDGNGDGTAGDDFFINFKTMAPPVSVEQELATPTFRLAQNYPNPFNPSTVISYQLSAVSFVSLKVYDLLGREIATIVSEVQSAGTHLARWNGRNDRGESVTSAMYLYQLRAGSLVITRKMLLLR